MSASEEYVLLTWKADVSKPAGEIAFWSCRLHADFKVAKEDS